MGLLITPTLLNSVDWLIDCPKSWKQRALDDLKAQIQRAPWKPTQAMQMGIEFEDEVYKQCRIARAKGNQEVEVGSALFKQVANRCMGGVFQSKYKKMLDIDGHSVALFGKLDVDFPSRIIDIKTVNEYRGPEKYLKGWQHIIYCYLKGVPEFEYLVAEWEDIDEGTLANVHLVPYSMGQHEATHCEDTIRDKIESTWRILQRYNLYDDYCNIFSKPRRR